MLNLFFWTLGHKTLKLFSILEEIGRFFLFHIRLIPAYFTPPFRLKELFLQMEIIGVSSSWVVMLTATFTGMVLAIQFYHGFHQFSAQNFISYPIFATLTRELAPVFGALMLTSRAISSMAAELGTMRVSEQIDALDLLAVDSRRYLLIPRIFATTLSLPLLVILFNFIGNLSAYFVSIHILDINKISYQSALHKYLSISDILISIIKASVFGYLIGLIGTYTGYHTKGGARGVGHATTHAVVSSAITIFGANYLLSALFLALEW